MGLKGLQTTLFSLVAFCALYVIPSYFRLLQNEGLPHEKYSPYIHVGVERAEHFLNQWAVHISGGPDIAEQVAEDLGFHYKGILYALPNHYLFSKKDHEPISQAESISHTVRLLNDPRVMWTQQQFAKHLEKRNSENREIWRLSRMMEQKSYRKETGISKYAKAFTDELWPMQWYMQDCRSSNTSTRIDFNVVPVYQELNITGRGVNIIVLDDGIDYGHEDLAASFSPDLSYNFNNDTNDCRPRSSDSRNKHGTRCAGQLVMKPNNSKCGVGICYGAKVGGVKMLDGPSSDVIESKALQFGLDKADIYSGSWGPPDDGKYMDGPGKLCAAAFDRGTKEGRKGKGVLYVFSAGNGRVRGDNCAADGYLNRIDTIAIACVRADGEPPLYSEACNAVMATAYSGGNTDPIKIITTDILGTCTCEHTGTSAASPFVAGVLALALEANPGLTWRDAQHLLAWSCDVAPVSHSAGWERNARKLWYHPAYGFGLINAFKLVSLAKGWTNVPPQAKCEIPVDVGTATDFSKASSWKQSVNVTACSGTADEVKFVEHIHATFTVEHPRRGDVQIEMTGHYYGTTEESTTWIFFTRVKSVLMVPRPEDDCKTGFVNWPILTLKHWGESPLGEWKFEVIDTKENKGGKVVSVKLTVYGTKTAPAHYSTARTYEYLVDSEWDKFPTAQCPAEVNST
ncbi:hypothetical protein M8J75_014340 [Diaphorina citri]|nr:hypothetical protein M8J75_014340 [Diaphorina citri]